ncbi:MAG TPA: OsmC family protein [Candidatus Dormibacteraeota bacterium]|nr:OsmC family protein [Candidatus Dormibacteraeota bacterium]
MADDLVVNKVHSVSTSTHGRSINEVRDQQLVIDEPTHLGGPGERFTPADAFLSGVSACGVLLVQGRARETRIKLDKIEVQLEAVRRREDTSVFQRIDMSFRLVGPSLEQAVQLVEHYKGH